jgi:hypothetical protein
MNTLILFILIYQGGSDVYPQSQRAQFCADSLIRTNPRLFKLTYGPGGSGVRVVTCTQTPEETKTVIVPADWLVQ